MSSKTSLDSPLAGVATDIEERRCDLIGRHRELKNKITTMERFVPALMAYNMWMTNRNCHDTPCKVQEIMKKFLPQPSPADKLLDELNSTVNNLYQETAQLHDKIINADVELEEADMELESLELANKELKQNLTELQQEVQRYKTPSLHSVHSEDLICLKKIRQFAEEELKLKTCIKELESKEDVYRRQMSKLLSCRELQRDKRVAEYMRKLEDGGKEQCSLDVYKHNMTKQTYALKDKEKRICCPCTTSVTLTDCEETSKRTKAREKLCPSLPCCVSLDIRASRTTTSKSRACEVCCKYCRQISSATLKFKSSCSTNRPCEFPLSAASGAPQLLKQVTKSSVSCEPGKSCNECEIAAACKRINSCRCDCEGICARKLSTLPCDYSIMPSSKVYQSTEVDDSNSDEEFCECCSCGCENSENSLQQQ